MATLFSIGEQIRSLLEGGDPPIAAKFDMEEVKRAAIQVINGLIKVQHVTEEMGGGMAIPDGSVFAEYDNVAVESWKGVARAALPAMPVKLPLNIGIFHVGPVDDPLNGFIPFESGQLQMLGEEPLISDILGQVGYEQSGKYIIFNKDITDNDEDYRITAVYMKLVVKDLTFYGDFDMLPIPASMEADVIQMTFQMLSGQMPANKKVDVINKQPEVQP